jgi:biopolymer transport protein ExbB/TolQ
MTAILLFLRGVPTWAWTAMGGLLLAWAAHSWAYKRGAESVRRDLQPRLEAAQANSDLLEGALAHQSRQIEALRADERKARQAVQNAARAGERVRGRVEAVREPSRAVGPSGCDTALEAMKLWGAL